MPSVLSKQEEICQTHSRCWQAGGTETAAGCDLPTIAYDPEKQFPITHSVIVLHDLPGNNDMLERFAREIFNKDAELTQVTRPDSLRRNFPTFRWIFAARTQEARTILGHREEMRPRWARHTPLPDVMIVFDSVLAIVEAEEVRYSAAKVPNPRSRIFLAGLGNGFNIASKLFFREPQAVGGLGGLIGLAGIFWMPNLPYLMAVARDFGPDSDNDNEKCRQFLKALRALYRGRQSHQSQNTASTEATSQDHVSLVRKLRETPIFLAYDPYLDGIDIKEAVWMSMLLQHVLRFKQVQYHDYTPETAPGHLTDTLWQRMLADIVAFLKSRSTQPS
ncbi:hypothetical protein B0H65DRAFT_177004 [Neurospora tetraspora]|uniref:Uncharacterized protein n=1 Tax=Neurospora tetraspora TaxID=94610 RepID=A0AAE0JIE4_9PEZI|nr:hypothetical protein B0H65DRAFT_177004 [Neurospora tetraspora]